MTARYLTVAGAAEYLSLTVRAVQGMIRRQEIPYHKVGRRIRFKVDDLDFWMDRQRVEAS